MTDVQQTGALDRLGRGRATRVRHRDVADLLAPQPRRGFPMAGFGEEFADIVDYIFKITHRIWAERGVGRIYDHYDHACLVMTASDITRSVEDVVAGTLGMMQAFPDRESRFLNVAWSGDDRAGYYTSHLGFSAMTNLGPSAFGAATGRRVRILHCADCISRDGRINTEWLVRDNGALVRQLGLDPADLAREQAARDAAAGRVPWHIGAPQRAPGQALPGPLDRPRATPEDRFAHLLHDVFNRRRLDRLAEAVRADAVLHSAPGREFVGLDGIAQAFIGLLAPFPDALFALDHFTAADETDGLIVAVRWSLRGHHRGEGMFGRPTGRPMHMLGMTHFRLDEEERVAEAWMLFDEVAVLRQLLGPA
jgi:predicted ester cyclase